MKNLPGYMTKRRHERKAQVIRFLGGKCVNCGTTEKLSFDHIDNDRQDREHTISWLLSGSWDKLLAELEKCQLLCLSCHAKKTAIDHGKGPSEHGTLARYVNQQCRCVDCRAENARRSRAYRVILSTGKAN